jgi:putative ABC transport system permease protein
MNLFAILWRQSLGSRTLGVLFAALVLAVTATTMLQFAKYTLLTSITQQAGQLLAADVAVSSSAPINPVWRERGKQLRQTEVLSFSSMAQVGEQFELVSVKAVEPAYPLRGTLLIQPAAAPCSSGQGSACTSKPPAAFASHAPAAGTIWVESRLLDVLHVTIGQQLRISDASLTVAGVIERDPNRELGFGGFAAEVIMNQVDVAATHVIQPGSRLDYRLLLAGAPDTVADFSKQYAHAVTAGERLRNAGQNNNRLNKPIRLFTDYAQLAGLLTVVLCGIAVALSARRFAAAQLDGLALLRCIGATERQLALGFFAVLAVLWVAAVLLGAVLGALGAQGLLALIKGTLPALEISFSPLLFIRQPLLTGMLTATVTLFGFALPSLWQLLHVSPLRVLRTEAFGSVQRFMARGGALHTRWLLPSFIALLLIGFVILQTGKVTFSLAMIAAVAMLLVVVFGLVWIVVMLLKRSQRFESPLLRQPVVTALQIMALALGLGLVCSVVLLRDDLLNRWQRSLPLGTPNQFVYGLPPDQKADFEVAIAANHWHSSPLYPIAKGRLLKINDTVVSAQLKRDQNLERELNLTMSAQIPSDSIRVAGGRFTAPMQVSVEEKVAEKLGLKLGDRVSMSLPEGDLTAQIVSIHSVDWNNFKPNFFFVYSAQSFDAAAGSYLGSFYVPPADHLQLAQVVQRFPTTMLIDVDGVMQEIRHLLDMLGQALNVLAGLVGLSGLLVLLASLHASMDERRREAALLRALGASQSQLRRRLIAELAWLGLGAGLLAVVIAESTGVALAYRFELAIRPHGYLWLIAPLLMMGLTVWVGLGRIRPLWTTPPALILRELNR